MYFRGQEPTFALPESASPRCARRLETLGFLGAMPVGLAPGRLVWTIVTTAIFLIPLAISAWAFLDAARRPQWAWSLAGRSQVTWMVCTALGILTLVGGLLISGWYLVIVRPEIADAEDGRFREG